MALAFYDKYRPKSLKEVCGQDVIKAILGNQVASNEVSHAYLFTGPAGTGKTTLARILAAMINCKTGLCKEPPKDDPFSSIILSNRPHMDIYEIDAASNRGIEDAKKLREIVFCPPIEMRKRIFIIDECHRLTPEAWDVLLKVLEEPPSYVIFMFCTTELNKVKDTIQTRCQCFRFKPLGMDEMVSYLKNLAFQEKILADDEVFTLLAAAAHGSLRDAISNLDLIKSTGAARITSAIASNVIGIPSRETVKKFVACAVKGDYAGGISYGASAIGIGVPAEDFIRAVAEFVHDLMMCDGTGYDFQKNGCSAEEAAKMPQIYQKLVDMVGQENYRPVIREWIGKLDESYKMTIFNLQPQCQVNVVFLDMLRVFKKYIKKPA